MRSSSDEIHVLSVSRSLTTFHWCGTTHASPSMNSSLYVPCVRTDTSSKTNTDRCTPSRSSMRRGFRTSWPTRADHSSSASLSLADAAAASAAGRRSGGGWIVSTVETPSCSRKRAEQNRKGSSVSLEQTQNTSVAPKSSPARALTHVRSPASFRTVTSTTGAGTIGS